MSEQTGVLVIGEVEGRRLSTATMEVLVAGGRLSRELAEPLSLGLAGVDLHAPAQEAIAYGADRVYLVETPLLRETPIDLYLVAMEGLCHRLSPSILLLGRTTLGQDVGPRLAFRLKVGLAQDCLEVKLDPQTRRLLANRPVYGGNAIATVSCKGTPQIASIRPKAYEPIEPDPTRDGEVMMVDIPLDPDVQKVRLLERAKEEAKGVKLEEARVVVAGGRGLGGSEPFLNELQELADLVGGSVGASRAAVDSGWAPNSYQVGLTGKIIAPELYITVGISGASQHMAGCSGARNIVSINRDAEANIFKEASFGVVGDWKRVLPAFIQTVKDLLKG